MNICTGTAIQMQADRENEAMCAGPEVNWTELWTEKLLADPDTVTDGIWACRFPKVDLDKSAEARKEYEDNQLLTLTNLFQKAYRSNGQDTESLALIGQIFADNYANYIDTVAAKSSGEPA